MTITAQLNSPERRRYRFPTVLLGAISLLISSAMIGPSGAAAQPAPPREESCSVEAFNDGECLVGVPTAGVSGLTAGVQAAVRSGRDDVVDKFAAQPFITDEMRTEIANARVNVPSVVYVDDDRPPEPGTIVPFGGSDGQVKTAYTWELGHSQPVETCDSSGCYVKDWTDITFNLRLEGQGRSILAGRFESRAGVGTFGVKDFSCRVRKDVTRGTDPVRGSFSGCVGTTRTTGYSVLESSVTNATAAQEPNWLHIVFESYDSRFGLSFGTFEYKSRNWTKDANGLQYFFVS